MIYPILELCLLLYPVLLQMWTSIRRLWRGEGPVLPPCLVVVDYNAIRSRMCSLPKQVADLTFFGSEAPSL